MVISLNLKNFEIEPEKLARFTPPALEKGIKAYPF